MQNLTPMKYRGQILEDYYIDDEGNPYSTKRGWLKELKVGGYNDPYNPYPRVGISIDGKSKSIMIHRLVCETFHNLPLPEILTEEEWNSIKPEIRNKLLDYVQHADRYQVNHINHNGHDYRPSNLEWVTVKENQDKYQEHKKKQALDYYLSME